MLKRLILRKIFYVFFVTLFMFFNVIHLAHALSCAPGFKPIGMERCVGINIDMKIHDSMPVDFRDFLMYINTDISEFSNEDVLLLKEQVVITDPSAADAIEILGNYILTLPSLGSYDRAKLESHIGSITPITVFGNLPQNTEIHTVGVYEGGGGVRSTEYPVQQINIDVTRENIPIVLVFSSYDSVIWIIRKTPKVKIAGVILSGYYDQKVEGVDSDTKIIEFTYASRRQGQTNYREFYTYDKNHKNFDLMRDTVREITGKEITSFQGGYRLSNVSIADDTVFAYDNTFAFLPDYKFPTDTEVHVVGVEMGVTGEISETIRSQIVGGGSGNIPDELVNVDIETGQKPVLLVLTSPKPILWNINRKNNDNIKGIVISGSLKQGISGNILSETSIIRQFISGHEYNSLEYNNLAIRVREITGLNFSSFRGGKQKDKIFVKAGVYFPNDDDLIKMTGRVDYPQDSKVYDSVGEQEYFVPGNCSLIKVMAWGGGGAPGSWSGFSNDGGGAGYTYSEIKVKPGEKLKVIVGGGGKIGTHADKWNIDNKSKRGKGGFPDGGYGSIGADGTGGGGGGTSRIKRGEQNLVIAGGGGGAGGHSGTGGEGGGRDAYAVSMGSGNGELTYNQRSSGKGGNNGVGGIGGKAPSYQNLDSQYGAHEAGNTGSSTNGGDGGQAGRKGGGGGGGGYGGGGGGGADFHWPGGGGGGGSLGDVMIPGDGTNPGNMEQSRNAGKGGTSGMDGSDGKVIIWCNCEGYVPNLDGVDLKGIDLGCAQLSGVDLSNEDLGGARLYSTNFIGANLSGANLRGATYGCSTKFPLGFDLKDANLILIDTKVGCKFYTADLEGENLSNRNLRYAQLQNSNLKNANLSGTSLLDSDLTGTNLEGADLTNAFYNAGTKWPKGYDYKKAGAVEGIVNTDGQVVKVDTVMVPTLKEWGMLILVIAFGVVFWKRREAFCS